MQKVAVYFYWQLKFNFEFFFSKYSMKEEISVTMAFVSVRANVFFFKFTYLHKFPHSFVI